MNRLKDKVCIITGSTSGIGEAGAKIFALEGAKVIIVGRDEARGMKVEKEITSKGGIAKFIKCDLVNEEGVKCLVNEVIKLHGRIDALYNNAGIEYSTEVTKATTKDWETILNINLRSVFYMIKHVIPLMKKGASIINTASMVGLFGLKNHSIYSASKGGIVALTKSVAADYVKKGIRINCICPGPVWTPIVKRHLGSVILEPLAKHVIKDLVPMGRFGKPSEIAWLAVYLASDESSFMTGAVIPCDGGTTNLSIRI